MWQLLIPISSESRDATCSRSLSSLRQREQAIAHSQLTQCTAARQGEDIQEGCEGSINQVCEFITIASALAYFRNTGHELRRKISPQSFKCACLRYVTISAHAMLQRCAAARRAELAGTQDQRGAERRAGDNEDSRRRGTPTSSSPATHHPTTPQHSGLITLLSPSPHTVTMPEPMPRPAVHHIAHACTLHRRHPSCNRARLQTWQFHVQHATIPCPTCPIPSDTGSQHQAGSPSMARGSMTYIPACSRSPPVPSTPRTATTAALAGPPPCPSTSLCMHSPSLADVLAPVADALSGRDTCNVPGGSLSPPTPHPSPCSLSPVNAACSHDINASSTTPHTCRPCSPICAASPTHISLTLSRVAAASTTTSGAVPALLCVTLQGQPLTP
ncbi:hypothetical protein EVG20_g11582 [Dentipellis fragilis]|uniref:Uncharacterized protein n=1 Tax=Dentipellis fragilis TaxID=205917 RepID=A0A4Y9XLV1_9AGAM|nr:hypothetical protein EVG20_g11582 [Dentipellis fragilis]